MYPNIYGSTPPLQPQQRRTVEKVTGRQGAEMYGLAPDSSALLLDMKDPIIWFVQTDSAGYKTVTPFDIKVHEDEQAPDIKSIDERLNGFDERLRIIEEALK